MIETENGAAEQPKQQVSSFTLGARTQQDLFSSKLVAMAHAWRDLPNSRHQNIVFFNSNKAAVVSNQHMMS